MFHFRKCRLPAEIFEEEHKETVYEVGFQQVHTS